MTTFAGAHVLITGGAGGIGRLMALGAQARGARLTILDRDQEAGRALLAELGGDAAFVAVDLTDRPATKAVCAQVLETRGPVDILINNAGIVTGKPFLEATDEAIERTFQVNALALFWVTRAFLPAMLARGRGHVVTVASAAGLAGTARLVDYCASKFAAVGFDEALRLELGRLGSPVRTTVVCPFYIDTGMFSGVRTRFPWLLPISRPGYVAGRILEAVRGNRRRLVVPRFVLLVLVVRSLPAWAFDRILGAFGINRTMDAFTGHPD